MEKHPHRAHDQEQQNDQTGETEGDPLQPAF
jgi:hypothetical protein